MKLNVITAVIIGTFAVIFLRHAMGLPWTATRIAGLAIAAPALALLLLARLQLGRAFSIRPKASNLVTSGLYSRIRNPIYVFGSMFILGLIIWADRPRLLLIFLLLIPMQIYRARKESEVLEARFGAEYVQYKQRTWF
jgi:protein-S-isoprenylcysteine O-methyltransferase Ste14